MKKSHIALLGILLLFVILFYTCKSDNDSRGTDDSVEIDSTKISSTNYSRISHVTFYIENSGSMFGYVNGPTEFVEVVNKLAQYPNLILTGTGFSYNMISGKMNPIGNEPPLQIYPIGSDANILKSTLTVDGLKKPSSSKSDLNEMFKIALKEAKSDSISIFISDGIYDVGGSSNPINALQTEVQSTTTNFIKRLQEDDIETLLVKLESDFKGSYHPANVIDPRGKSETIDHKRPYYIWIFGNSDLLNEYFSEDRLVNLNGYVDIARFRKVSKDHPSYEAISYNNFGFRKDLENSKTFELYSNVTETTQFTIAVDFSKLNLPESYLVSKSNYNCSNNYFVKEITTVEKNIGNDLRPYLESLNFKPTHILTIVSNTKQPELDNVKITLSNILPNWIEETNIDNDYPLEGNTSQTFRFSTLIKSINEAYTEVSNPKYLAQFNVTIKN
jgi:hypothetical protein